jgi:hypothetical protein
MGLRVIMLGDVVGTPGRQAVAQLVPRLREQWKADLIIANAENVANGSGITPAQYIKLRRAGVDGVTLGDHAYKRSEIVPTLERESAIIRPANLPALAKGRTWMRLRPGAPPPADTLDGAEPAAPEDAHSGQSQRSVFVMTLLGRIFASLPANDPFATADRVLGELPEAQPLVIVEVHAEATSEKQALGWYLDGRVAAVIGTHTHVPTADAKILPRGTAYITDIGMCGPHHSILGRKVERVLTHMTTGMHVPFDVAEEDVRVQGVLVDIDESTGRALAVERIELRADTQAPPFV